MRHLDHELKHDFKKLGKVAKKQAKKQASKALKQAMSAAVQQGTTAVLSGAGGYNMGVSPGVRVSGRGSYTAEPKMKMNSLFTNTPPHSHIRSSTPGSSTDSSIVIEREEYLGSFYSGSDPVAFNNLAFDINPASLFFPWLSQIAMNYVSYEFIQLAFYTKTQLSTYASSGAMGSLMLSFTYNASELPFTNQLAMESYDGTISSVPYENLCIGVECARRDAIGGAVKYTLQGAPPTGTDKKMYYKGVLQIASAGLSLPADTLITKLYCSYQVKLITPKIYQSLGNAIAFDNFCAGGTQTQWIPFGPSPTKDTNNTIGGTLSKTGTSSSDAQSYTFPDGFTGHVQVFMFINGASPGGGFEVSKSGNISDYTIYCPDSSTDASTIRVDGSNAIRIAAFYVKAASVSNGNYLRFYLSAGFPPYTGGSLLVFATNPNQSLPSTYVAV